MGNNDVFTDDIKGLCFDVDGVLTDGGVLITESGDLLRKMNTRDGFSLKYALKKGFPVGIITGGNSAGVIKRLQGLGIEDIHAGIEHKIPIFNEWCKKQNLDTTEVLYTGDDIPDLEIMEQCGATACPSDAASEIREVVDYISPFKGGRGCVRDITKKFLSAHGAWGF